MGEPVGEAHGIGRREDRIAQARQFPASEAARAFGQHAARDAARQPSEAAEPSGAAAGYAAGSVVGIVGHVG